MAWSTRWGCAVPGGCWWFLWLWLVFTRADCRFLGGRALVSFRRFFRGRAAVLCQRLPRQDFKIMRRAVARTRLNWGMRFRLGRESVLSEAATAMTAPAPLVVSTVVGGPTHARRRRCRRRLRGLKLRPWGGFRRRAGGFRNQRWCEPLGGICLLCRRRCCLWIFRGCRDDALLKSTARRDGCAGFGHGRSRPTSRNLGNRRRRHLR